MNYKLEDPTSVEKKFEEYDIFTLGCKTKNELLKIIEDYNQELKTKSIYEIDYCRYAEAVCRYNGSCIGGTVTEAVENLLVFDKLIKFSCIGRNHQEFKEFKLVKEDKLHSEFHKNKHLLCFTTNNIYVVFSCHEDGTIVSQGGSIRTVESPLEKFIYYMDDDLYSDMFMF